MKRTRDDFDWPVWFDRPFFDWSESWRSMFGGPPALKVEEFDDNGQLVVRAEMPGIDPDKDVEITVSDHVLTLRAERRSETKTEDKKGFRSEFQYGSFARSLRLPEGATEADVKATYADGILEVRIPIDAVAAVSEATRVPIARG
jgi:HSP20 family protein